MQLTEIKNEIEVYKTFGEFTETHEAIAAFRIQKLRASVIQNRVFLTEVSDIYSLVKSFYMSDTEAQKQKSKQTKKSKLLGVFRPGSVKIGSHGASFLKKNGKNLSILLTSNTGFYGGILKNLFDDYIEYVSTNPSDIAIVGKAGRDFYAEAVKEGKIKPSNEHRFFGLDDEHPTDDEFNKIIGFARNYEAIVVHYVQFFSVLTQIPYYSNIAGEVGMIGEADKNQQYVFEPSYEDILMFFETQILEAIFRQKVFEHQLARYGGKLVAMDDAVTSSKEEVKKLERQKVRAKKQMMNKKQQEVFSAILGNLEEI
jgi:F0F1-type ATP synthase gamma subunit